MVISIRARSLLLFFAFVSIAGICSAAEIENPPIPPKRPAVLRASKAYIEELRARINSPKSATQQIEPDPLEEIYHPQSQQPEASLDQEQALSASPPAAVVQESLADDLALNLKEASREDILNALDNKEKIPEKVNSFKKADTVIRPKQKPVFKPDIEPSAGNEEPPIKPKIETSKLISFYMQPEQINLDENLSTFLRDHAIKLMQEDNDLDIEIHSYATSIKGEDHSEIRISLARALEVRTFLINSNIDPSRLKLKTQDNYGKHDQDDRIDLMFVKRM